MKSIPTPQQQQRIRNPPQRGDQGIFTALPSLTILCALLLTAASSAGEIPFPNALDAAAVVQTPMEPEIPGSLILGNGDLNGILWHHNGQLRFSITKNDACDGRLETAQDPELVRIDVANHRWTTPDRCRNPPSWSHPYPCPVICGHVELGEQVEITP